MHKDKFKVGDRVRIVKKVGNSDNFYWSYMMDDTVDMLATVDIVADGRYYLSTGWWYLPESLELIQEETIIQEEKVIDINKKYKTRDGRDVEIFKIMDISNNYPNKERIIGIMYDSDNTWELGSWYADGGFFEDRSYPYDLVEVQPYKDFQIDDKVVVWQDTKQDFKLNRHFAGIDRDGRPLTWYHGGTSFSTQTTAAWDNCVKYEE